MSEHAVDVREVEHVERLDGDVLADGGGEVRYPWLVVVAADDDDAPTGRDHLDVETRVRSEHVVEHHLGGTVERVDGGDERVVVGVVGSESQKVVSADSPTIPNSQDARGHPLGMHAAERVTLARLPSGMAVETTLHTYGSGDPTVYVQAAQHGREVNGVEVLRRVHEELLAAEEELDGTLVAVPVADPLTFDHVSYTTPPKIDAQNANMNRVWPGDPEGTVHQRMAARLWDHIEGADAVVDLHTGSRETLTHTVYRRGDPTSKALALAFGTEVCLAEAADEDADDEWAEQDFDGKLRVAASGEGIPAITPELAHNRELVEPAIETGVRGVFNVLRHLGMLPGEPETPADQRLARNHLGRVEATASGLFRLDPEVTVGQRVEGGTPLGRVTHPTTYETLQRVDAGDEGLLYSVTREATVTAGSTLAGVALPLDEGGDVVGAADDRADVDDRTR